jgi:hypothetical protein
MPPFIDHLTENGIMEPHSMRAAISLTPTMDSARLVPMVESISDEKAFPPHCDYAVSLMFWGVGWSDNLR